MTTINAMRFNFYCGAMFFDETRSWNPEDMKIYAADKMKIVTEQEITDQTGLVAAYGNTGTSSLGEELRTTIRRRLRDKWHKLVEQSSKLPTHFMTIEEIAYLVYDLICEIKHKHTDEALKGKFGFTTDDFTAGFYAKDGEKYEIKDKDVVETAEKYLTWKGMYDKARPLFLNNGIVLGFEPKEGFRIFHVSIISQFCTPVETFFQVDGSGRDQCELVLGDYASCKCIPERRGEIDPVEGLMNGIQALEKAFRTNLGVGGYTNIAIFDGRKPHGEMSKKIFDERARLAYEIIKANVGEFTSKDTTYGLIKNLCFEDYSWADVNKKLFASATDAKGLGRYLRGYGYKE